MMRLIFVCTCLLWPASLWASSEKPPSYPRIDYEVARTHEIKPHRFTIPLAGMTPGLNQLHLTLIVSPTGDVVDAHPAGAGELLKFWPQLQGEVRQWKFTPFEVRGKAVTASVEEYIDLVPPERLPTKHVAAPTLRPDSTVEITLQRSDCLGSCPSYSVTVSTEGIVFEGRSFVVAVGKHTDRVDPDEVRKLAKGFVAADFYSMDDNYSVMVTDEPSFDLSVVIDGQTKRVTDYVGAWGGMPAVITELETKVDAFARTDRWVKGGDGLVQALKAEKFNFHSHQAQELMKEAASRGESGTVRELLEAGVRVGLSGGKTGWLQSASSNFETLKLLIDAGASKNDQSDKNLALMDATRSGSAEATRALIAYGANPNAQFSKRKGMVNVISTAARSGNPEVVREILRSHPKLEEQNEDDETAIFAAAQRRSKGRNGCTGGMRAIAGSSGCQFECARYIWRYPPP